MFVFGSIFSFDNTVVSAFSIQNAWRQHKLCGICVQIDPMSALFVIKLCNAISSNLSVDLSIQEKASCSETNLIKHVSTFIRYVRHYICHFKMDIPKVLLKKNIMSQSHFFPDKLYHTLCYFKYHIALQESRNIQMDKILNYIESLRLISTNDRVWFYLLFGSLSCRARPTNASFIMWH